MPSPIKKKYLKTQAEYATQYSVSTDTIARYQTKSAPLDQPEKMAAWLAVSQRHFPKTMKFEVEPAEPSGSELTAWTGDDSETDEVDTEVTTVRVGARVEIEQLEKECRAVGRLYSQNKTSPVKGPAYLKDWTTLIAALRQMQKDTPKSEGDDMKSIAIDSVERALVKNLLELKTLIESLPGSVAMKLSHLEPEILVEMETAMNDEAAHVIRAMQEGKWIPE